MNETQPTVAQHPVAPAGCPMHDRQALPLSLDYEQYLVFPQNKRVIAQYLKNETGGQSLFLFYGDQEISFDEPDLFAFGETLALQARFMAGSSTSWGQGYTWARMRELLEQLLEAGILELAQDAPAPGSTTQRYEGARNNPLPPAVTTSSTSWMECETITRELAGRSVELAHLELVIPVFRIAHIAIDAEGRQVGEANVFPKALRLDVPTNWRACIYPGSRYQDERPMNVSALKSMRQHWPQMMAAILRIREAYLHRFPSARSGWTVGDVERLSTLVLAIPTYLLVKEGGRLGNGQMHPVLSNLFRVTDGVRMTTHQMLFVPVAEATLSPLAATSSADIYAYAERNHAFASTHGVCAGPKAMIQEFLAVLLDGRGEAWESVALDAEVETALSDINQAFDYGLLGLQAHAVVFSLWPMMTRTYDQLHAIVTGWKGERTAELETLQAHLQEKVNILKNQTLHATEEWRANREMVYADIYAHCNDGLGRHIRASLAEQVSVGMGNDADCLKAQLSTLIAAHLKYPMRLEEGEIGQLADCLSYFFRQSRAVLRIATATQQAINSLLNRSAAKQPFTLADMDVHVVLQGSEARRLPHLLDALQELLGFTADITRDGIAIKKPNNTPNSDGAPLRARPPEFADIGSADTRALSTI